MGVVKNHAVDTNVAIVGGGLVGSLLACFLAERGYSVDLFEMRHDIRKMSIVKGKSINLALSERGRSALRAIGLEDKLIEEYTIPMKGRLIHDLDGSKRYIPYDNNGQCIYSISRRRLNEILISRAENYDNIKINFGRKITDTNLENGTITSKNIDNNNNDHMNDCENEELRVDYYNSIIGTDGAHSIIRRKMVKDNLIECETNHIEHGYIELEIQPINGKHAMEVNYLHIWPRHTFMMIALPNKDGSYTVTLFMPFNKFNAIDTKEKLTEFFELNFPDCLKLIGREKLIETYFKSQPNTLTTVKCSKYNYKDKVLLMGDAAHAMVPFYGQGMNCGFEDCLIFDQLLSKMPIENALSIFNENRLEDCHTICDLAVYNYTEMRDAVNSRVFLIRKRFDQFLNSLFPRTWIPLYTMVTFTRIPYKQCLEQHQKQTKMINASLVAFIAATSYMAITIGRSVL